MLIAGTTSFAFAEGNIPDGGIATTDSTPPTDGTWVFFQWDGIGPAIAVPGSPWEVDCGVASCWLKITDGGLAVDEFEAFDNGVSILVTSPGAGSGSCADPDDCFANPDFSSGMACLGPGMHSITIDAIRADVGAGGGWLSFEQHSSVECGPVGGAFLPIDSTALLLAGAQTNAVWIMSALAVIGSVAFGALYITSKKN